MKEYDPVLVEEWKEPSEALVIVLCNRACRIVSLAPGEIDNVPSMFLRVGCRLEYALDILE